MHIQDPAQKAWIQERIEIDPQPAPSSPREGKRAILERLTAAEVFERFLDRKYTGTKRFGLDGGETTDPGAGADPEARQPARHQGGGASAWPIAAGSTCWPISWASPSPRSSRNSRAIPPIPRTSRARATSNTISAPRPTASSTASVVHLSLTANPSHLEAVNHGGAGQGARQAAASAAIPSAAGAWRCCCMAMPPSPARGWWPRRSISPSSRATAPAARSISSSTTRSASPPTRSSRAPAPIARTSPRSSRRRSSTSTATIRRRWCMSRASPPSSASSSRRTWSSTCSATAASAITRATSRPSPSR